MFIGSQALAIAVLSPGVAVGYSNLRLPFGLVPTEATIDSYKSTRFELSTEFTRWKQRSDLG